MQTFLPYEDFISTAQCLDYRRLGKQRVEAKQIISALEDPTYGWQNHPAVTMWRGYVQALKVYANVMISEWVRRGYNNTMPLYAIKDACSLPWWIGNEEFHASHRANLLRKDMEFYSKFNWTDDPDMEYVWPTKHLVRR